MSKKRYKDLESLLYTGFITLKIKIGNVNFILKTISDFEYDYVKMISGVEKDPFYNYNFHINYLFHSIFMVNGLNLLNLSDNLKYEVKNYLKKLPSKIIQVIFDNLDILSKKMNECVRLVEPYFLENDSRYNWKFRKNFFLNSPSLTGVNNSNLLGLNQFQKFWIVLNINEDSKELFEEKYTLTKFLASFTDPKAVRKVEASDKVRKEEEEKRKERLRVIGTEEEVKFLSGPTDTRDGIIEELEKQMSGKKDAHDLAIEEYEKSLRLGMLKQMQEVKKIRDRRKKELVLEEEARAISPEEMAERLAQRNNRTTPIVDPSENYTKAKFLQMSNVSDEDILKEEKIMTSEEYRELINDDLFKGMHQTEEDRAEEEYRKEQNRLANMYEPDEMDSLSKDFPNLRN